MKREKNNYQNIFEHTEYIVVAKPAGLLSVLERFTDQVSLKRLLRDRYGEIYTVHRLDQFTSGLMLFARNLESHKIWNEIFRERKIVKKYMAIVEGRLRDKEGVINAPVMKLQGQNRVVINKHGKKSKTTFKVVEQFGSHALLEMQLHTGRTHQIRIHLKSIGHPLMVDSVYGSNEAFLVSSVKGKNKFHLEKGTIEHPLLTRTPLHASFLGFEDPFDKTHRRFQAPLPKDMRATLHQLGKWDKY